MGPVPQHEQVDLPALADREGILADLERVICEAWESFDSPRPAEPQLDEMLIGRLEAPLPQKAGDPDAILAEAARILDASISPSRPLYLAYIGSTGLEIGVLASALLAARERALPGSRTEGLGARRAAVYCSEESHHSVVRAVEVCGLGSNAVRLIPIDGRHRMRPDALEDALARDVAAGIVPVAVVATAGTTLTGAVDPLEEIAEVCERHDVWLHVDGAYGLPGAAAPSTAHLFSGLERADSATIDAHKWLGVQKSCSAVLLREAGRLRAAFGHEERYMLHEGDIANPVDRTLEYSRPFRSLRL